MNLFKRKAAKISPSLLRTGDIFVEYQIYKGKNTKGDHKFIDSANAFNFVNAGIISIERTQSVNAIYFDKEEGWISIEPAEHVLSRYHIFRTNLGTTADPTLSFPKAIAVVANSMANGVDYLDLREKYKAEIWAGMQFHNSQTIRPKQQLGSYAANRLVQNDVGIPSQDFIRQYAENYLCQPSMGFPEIRFITYVMACASNLMGLRVSEIVGPELDGGSNAIPRQLARALGKSRFFTEFKNITA